MQHLKGKEEFSDIPDWVVGLSRSSQQNHFVVTNSRYQEFSKEFQMKTVCFPPSKPSGPDILAWLQGTQETLVSVQCKKYEGPLKNSLTKATVSTLDRSRKSLVRILFSGQGAQGRSTVDVTGTNSDIVTVMLQIDDIKGLHDVAKIGAVYVAKYGEEFNANLEKFVDEAT